MEERCEICGEPATQYFGYTTMPLCESIACYHAAADKVNEALAEAVKDNKKGE